MAQVPYNGGIADAQPDARPPDDTQRIEANPSSFGGAIAQGAEKAGAGAVDLSKFWGRVQSQDASNNAEKEASDLLVHAKSLEGQDALDAQQTIFKNLDAIRDKYRKLLYFNASRRYSLIPLKFTSANEASTARSTPKCVKIRVYTIASMMY